MTFIEFLPFFFLAMGIAIVIQFVAGMVMGVFLNFTNTLINNRLLLQWDELTILSVVLATAITIGKSLAWINQNL